MKTKLFAILLLPFFCFCMICCCCAMFWWWPAPSYSAVNNSSSETADTVGPTELDFDSGKMIGCGNFTIYATVPNQRLVLVIEADPTKLGLTDGVSKTFDLKQNRDLIRLERYTETGGDLLINYCTDALSTNAPEIIAIIPVQTGRIKITKISSIIPEGVRGINPYDVMVTIEDATFGDDEYIIDNFITGPITVNWPMG